VSAAQGAKVAASGTTSSGSAPRSSRVWQEERAARTGRGASGTQADPCCASSRYEYTPVVHRAAGVHTDVVPVCRSVS